MLALAWDAIIAGVQAGQFAGSGFETCLARLLVSSKRLGHTGRLATALRLDPPVAQDNG
jgi:hypothetical protein